MAGNAEQKSTGEARLKELLRKAEEQLKSSAAELATVQAERDQANADLVAVRGELEQANAAIAAVQTPAAERGVLFGAVSGLALTLAPDIELAPKDANEHEVDLAIRLLGEIDARAQAKLLELAELAEEQLAELARLKRSLAGHKGRGTRLERQVEALAAELPEKPRQFEPPAVCAEAEQLLELIEIADTVQLLFVDERGTEIKGLAPRTIEGGARAWQKTSAGLRLRVPDLTVSGPGDGGKPYLIGGYALLLDDELAALRPRDQLTLGVGGRYQLKDDVIF
jgi:hypothetical protein